MADVRRPLDRWLLFFALTLTALGMVWVYSASGFKNPEAQGVFLTQQIVAGLIGIALMMALSQLHLASIQENPRLLQIGYWVLVILLLAVFIFPSVKGAHRWIRIMGQRFQPSEFFKPLSVLITAWWMAHYQESWAHTRKSLPRLVVLTFILALPLGLILIEPDFGTPALICLVILAMVFLGGLNKTLLFGSSATMLAIATVAILMVRYRIDRILDLILGHSDPLGKGYQALQSLIAVGSGGLTGVGVGQSMQKLNYLPEAHNDFIFAVLAEETGLVGTCTVLLLFLAILYRGFCIAYRARDCFLRLCAIGFTLLLVIQSFMNISVVICIAPNKGIPLPFVSYGGTSLIASLGILGLLLAVSKNVSEFP